MTTAATLPALVQSFFMDRLMQQRQASPHTIASYRDTFRLLLQFAQIGKQVAQPKGSVGVARVEGGKQDSHDSSETGLRNLTFYPCAKGAGPL